MKKEFKSAVTFALLAVAMAGCQKEIPEASRGERDSNGIVSCITSDNYVFYDGIVDMASWEQNIRKLVEEGYTVVVNYRSSSMKDKETFSTYSWDEAYKWATDMGKNGYAVSIEYDKTTGLYTCIAIK